MNIVFFDGVCGLCDTFVTFVFERDRQHVYRFAPLQGPTAKQYLNNQSLSDEPATAPASIVLLTTNGQFTYSTAALKILSGIGGIWRVFYLLLLIPRPIRDAVYRFIARHRYQWFGKNESCRLPLPDERAYFLD